MISGASAHQLDLTSPIGFTAAADWIKQNVLLAKEKAPMLCLDVILCRAQPSQPVTVNVFVDTRDCYIVGFRGKEHVYLLRDDGRDVKNKLLRADLIGASEKVTVIEAIGSDHRSLGTFLPIKGTSGMRARSYEFSDITRAGRLSQFRHDGGTVTYQDVCSALSLPDKAKRITRYADVFSNHVLADRIEKLQKRAKEIESLADTTRYGPGLKDVTPQQFLEKALAKVLPRTPPAVFEAGQRLCMIAEELHVDASGLREIVSLCSDQAAVRSAIGGVVMPPV